MVRSPGAGGGVVGFFRYSTAAKECSNVSGYSSQTFVFAEGLAVEIMLAVEERTSHARTHNAHNPHASMPVHALIHRTPLSPHPPHLHECTRTASL